MNIKTLGAVVVGATAIGLSAGVAPATAATFLGNAVQADFLFPDAGTVGQALGTKTIDLDGETFISDFAGLDALVTSTNIRLANTIFSSFNPVEFGGIRFT